jgi:hypothetical protein
MRILKSTIGRIASGVLLLAVLLSIALGSRAQAAEPLAVEKALPGVCQPSAPVPQLPSVGVPGLFADRPSDPPDVGEKPVDPAHLYETSGFSGMSPFTYDLGCSINVTNWGKHLNAWGDESLARKLVGIGQASTAAADATSRFAFDPSWVTKLLGTLANKAITVISKRILLPFLGLGLLFCTVMLFRRAKRGDTAGVMSQITWVMIVLLIGGFVIMAPTKVATSTQAGVGAVTSSLYEGASPAQAATDRAMEAIHYDGWLRRTFGTDESDTARTYGPALLAATRITWAQAQATDPALAKDKADREERIKDRQALLKEKSDAFKKIAGEVKDSDPAAYRWLTGEQAAGSGPALYEMAFALTVAFFRIFANLLMIMCILLLAILGIVWLLASPWLVTPQGHRTGKGLLDTTSQALGIVVTAAIGTWLYTVYTEAVMQPGWPTWVSFLLMGLGVFIFWTALRPDRKALALMSAGRIRGHGRLVRHVVGKVTGIGAMAWAVSKGAAAGARESEEEHEERMERVRDAHAHVTSYLTSAQAAPASEPSDDEGSEAPGAVLYRPSQAGEEFVPDPVPPPANTQTEFYTRPLDVVREEYARMAAEQDREEARKAAQNRHRQMFDTSTSDPEGTP